MVDCITRLNGLMRMSKIQTSQEDTTQEPVADGTVFEDFFKSMCAKNCRLGNFRMSSFRQQ